MQGSILSLVLLEDEGDFQCYLVTGLTHSQKKELRADNPGSFFRGHRFLVPKQDYTVPDGDVIAVKLLGFGDYQVTCESGELDQVLADNPGGIVSKEGGRCLVTVRNSNKLVA